MEFDREHEGRKYALLSPVFEQNATLKSEASAAGVTVTFDKAAHGYRLYEDVVPAGIDADAVFGKYTSDEAKAASAAERAEFESKLEKTDRQTSAKYDETQLYYPPQAEREAFKALKEEVGATFTYSPRAGAFVHQAGDASAFAKWQTPEMKAQWKSEFKERENLQSKRIDNAAKAVDKLGKVAEGRGFLAQHEHGFMVPSKTKHPELHETLVTSLSAKKENGQKVVSDEDLTQVFNNSKAALNALERQQFAIRITAAQAKIPELTEEQFKKLDDKGKHAAAGFRGLKDEEFSKMVALRSGFLALRTEMVARDLIKTTEAAKEIVAKSKKNEAGQSPHSKEQKLSAKAAEPEKVAAVEKATPEKANAKPAAAPKGPSKDGAKPAQAGQMANALLNAGLGR